MSFLRMGRSVGSRIRTAMLAAVLTWCVWSAAQGAAEAGEVQPLSPVQESPNPPAWTRSSSSCDVELADAESPSGVVGYIGYNVSILSIVGRRNVTCAEAKELARAEWVNGPLRRPLRWRYVRAWRSTSGSAYVGDFVGTKGAKMVEFLAVH
jgi:hypothetical protein